MFLSEPGRNLRHTRCIFCSEGGSGDFAASSSLSVADQLAYGKDLIRPKYNGHNYIAYFQAYTNTYAPACHLRRILPKRFLIQKYAFYLSQRVRIAFHLKSLHCLPN